MEPMTLGSPVGGSTQSPNSPGTNLAYLPNFLLGDSNMHSRLGAATPEFNRFQNNSGVSSTSPVTSYNNPEFRTNRQRAMFANNNSSNGPQIGTENHVGGPPTRGLFDTLETSSITSPLPVTSPITSPLNPFSESKNNQVLSNSPSNYGTKLQSRNAYSSFMDLQMNLSSNSNNNETSSQGLLQWVTVFGFPMSALNTVLSYISSRVRVIDKHPAPHLQCNWMHLKCSAEQEAQRALACNGNIVSGSIMIGVIPCTDEGVILGSDKENRSRLNGSMRLFSTPVKQSPKSPGRIQGVRPLVSNYPHASPQTVTSPESVPQKSTGLLSKTMEYVFGW